jgi:hypothetical protein
MFNFDEFINKPAIAMFGRLAKITPAKSEFPSFEIMGDFHEDYKEVGFDDLESSVASSKIVIFIRDADLPDYYPKINQGDLITVAGKNYQIVDVQIHIPGSRKLILHESNQSSSSVNN